MKTLKNLLIEAKISGKTDIQIIEEWFIVNNCESEGLSMISKLAESKSNKIQKQLDYARTWIPNTVDMRDVVSDTQTATIFNRIFKYCILGLDLSEYDENWAKENIPKMNIPKMFFMPCCVYLKKRYGIEFKDKPNLDVYESMGE